MDQVAQSAPVSSVGGSDQGQSLSQAVQAIVGAAASLSEVSAKLNQMADSVSENIKKQSVSDDQDVSTQISGAYDEYDNKRLADASNHRMMVLAERALSLAIERDHKISLISHDHFSALPPVAAKPSGC